MTHAEFKNDVGTFKAQNPKRLVPQKQIRFDIDSYSNGTICQLHIGNAIACDMSEYPIAIRFLETIRRDKILDPSVASYCSGLIRGLTKIENWRNAHHGISYVHSDWNLCD